VSAWWSYRLEDFLMFSPRIYARLFEQANAAAGPWLPLLLAAGVAGLAALVRGRGMAWLGAGLGLAWLCCSLLFLRGLYEPINWAVGALWPPLLALALLLPALGWVLREDTPPCGLPQRVAVGLAAWAVLVHPLWAPLAGQGVWQAELLALAPDPTAIATLAWLVVLPQRPGRHWQALVALAWLPVLAWCAFSTLMLAAMGDARAAVLPLAAALALGMRLGPWGRSAGGAGRSA
jgi:hypothetical protein